MGLKGIIINNAECMDSKIVGMQLIVGCTENVQI